MYKIGYLLLCGAYARYNIVACISEDIFKFYANKQSLGFYPSIGFCGFLTFPVLCRVDKEEILECIYLDKIPVYNSHPTPSTGFAICIDESMEKPVLLYNNEYFPKVFIESEYERRFVDLTLLRAAAVHQTKIYRKEMSYIDPYQPDNVKWGVIKKYKSYIDKIDINDILKTLYVNVSESYRCKIGDDDTYSIFRTARITDESIVIDDYLKDIIGIGERVCIYKDSGYTSVYNLANYAEGFRAKHPIGEYEGDMLEQEKQRIIAQYSKEEHMAYLFYSQLRKQAEVERVFNKWMELKQKTDRDLDSYYHTNQLDNYYNYLNYNLNEFAQQIQSEECDDIKNIKGLIPYNSIWYISLDGGPIELNEHCFDAKLMSHTYINGRGILTFDRDVTRISNAFCDCKNLLEITLPNSINANGISAFCNCPNLRLFKSQFASEDGRCLIVDGELRAFASAGLYEYRIPDEVASIGNEAFKGCDTLKSITITHNVTKIGDCAFDGCSNLEKFISHFATDDGRCIVINNKVISFAPAGLNEYFVPNGITSIGYCAFAGCTNLHKIHLPSRLKYINSFAFSDCKSLSSITIPQSVDYIGSGAFSGCKSLVRFIGKYASDNGRCLIRGKCLVAYAEASGEVYLIPKRVTCINDGAFYKCNSLAKIVLSENTKFIRYFAFWGCSNISEIILPDTINSIDTDAFAGCKRLQKVYCKSIEPPRCWGAAFDNCYDNLKIYVPKESEDRYNAADGWKEYADKIIGYNYES